MPDEQNGQDMEQDVQEEVTTSETPAELPEDTKERTKQEFEKLKERNRRLAEEVEKLKKPTESALESLQPQVEAGMTQAPNLTQQQVVDTINGLVDENGYLDQALLENTLRQANQQVAEAKAEALRAKQAAQQAMSKVSEFEITREARIAHKKFPMVDPNNEKFDPVFYRRVKNELLGAMYEGKTLRFVDACSEVSQNYTPRQDVSDTKAKAVEEYKKTVTQKSALNMSGSSRPDVSRSEDQLIEGTRKGDAESIAARLKKIGY